MALTVAVAAGVPCLVLLTLVGVRRIRSLPFTQTPAVARGGNQRGIALQTVIIMVVLLAIAGGIAAVLLQRGQEAETQLAAQAVGVNVYAATNNSQCDRLGGNWATSGATLTQVGLVQAAGRKQSDGTDFTTAAQLNTAGFCAP